MATLPRVNLGTCHTVVTVEKLILIISCPQDFAPRWVGQNGKILCKGEARVLATVMVLGQ